MRTVFSSIHGAAVLSQETQSRIGTVSSVLIDPKKLKIEGFTVAIPQFIRSLYRFIVANDITRVGSTVVVRSEDVLCEVEDIVRLQPIILQNIPILGARVFTNSSQYLGKVYDIQFETETLLVTQILVKSFFLPSRTIPVQQIKTINQQGIWLHDLTLTVDLEAEAESTSTYIPQFQET